MKWHKFILVVVFVIEIGMLSFLRGKFGIYYSPIILFLASLFIGIYPIIVLYKNKITAHETDSIIPPNRVKIALIISSIIIGILISSIYLSKIFTDYEINAKKSDIIPCINILVTRVLNKEFPYKTISDWGYDLSPNYMPLTWMPFIIAKIINFDFRWLAFSVWCLSVAFYTLVLLRKNLPLIHSAFLSLLPFVVLLTLTKYEPAIFGYTIEPLIAGYYLILSLTILSKSNLIRAIGLILCLLSRYSLILWIPFYLTTVFFLEKKRNAIIILVLVLIAIFLVYYLPFVSSDWTVVKKGHEYYTTCALGEWNLWQNQGDKPYNLFRGAGFACYFYDFLNVNLLDRLKILQYTHYSISILSVLILGFLYMSLKKQVDYRLYLLFSLKIYLTFFYNFIQVPYTYLFMVPLFISLVIIFVIFTSTVSSPELPKNSG